MNTISTYFNPFSDQFRQTIEDFNRLSLDKKIAVAASAIFGAISTFYLLGVGGIALFQLSVRWLKNDQGCKGIQVVEPLRITEGQCPAQSQVQKLYWVLVENDSVFESYAEEKGLRWISKWQLENGYTGKGYHIQSLKYCLGGDFVDGHWYKGQVASGFPNGKGIYRNEQYKKTISGEFRNGEVYGYAKIVYDDGKVVEGTMAWDCMIC